MKTSEALAQRLGTILDTPVYGTYEEMYAETEMIVDKLAGLVGDCIQVIQAKEWEHELDTPYSVGKFNSDR